MDERLTTLNLVLDELGLRPEVGTLADRIRVQKAIYLGQRFGIELGYRFGWYKMGPYSPDLAKDSFALAAALSNGEVIKGQVLREDVRQKLARAAPLMQAPSDLASLTQEDWLECLASIDYLTHVSRLTYNACLDAMKSTPKERLLPFAERARAALDQVR